MSLPASAKRPGDVLIWAALYVAAFVTSLFFNGTEFVYFSTTFVLLLLLALASVWHGPALGLHMPRSSLALALGAFTVWLAFAFLWTPVPHASVVTFCQIGSLPLVFLLATLARDPEAVWKWSAGAVLLVALSLAVVGLYQVLVHGYDARSVFPSRNTHAALILLAAVPAASHYLIQAAHSPRTAPGWVVVLFLMFFGIAVTGSRGVMLSLVLGIGLIMFFSRRQASVRRLWLLPALIAVSYLATFWVAPDWTVQRFGALLDPRESGHDRLLIWSGALNMLAEHPWRGFGLGTFWLAWPPYRLPPDSSSGYFAHNDYLQIWIETGLPGVLLLVAVYASVVWMFFRARHARARDATEGRALELNGLFAGVMGFALHSFFDFDLYVLPITLVVGLMLARFHWLARPVPAAVTQSWRLPRWLSAGGFRAIALALLLLPGAYFVALGVSGRAYDEARQLAARGAWGEATVQLRRAWHVLPWDDVPYVVHADMLRAMLSALPADSMESRKLLYLNALELLENAERVNPLRPLTFFVRGRLYRDNPDLSGQDGQQKAMAAYQAALRLDPRAFRARTAYAHLFLEQGRTTQARQVLDGGIEYWYFPEPDLLDYYALAIALHRQAGDTQGAADLERRAQRVRQFLEQ